MVNWIGSDPRVLYEYLVGLRESNIFAREKNCSECQAFTKVFRNRRNQAADSFFAISPWNLHQVRTKEEPHAPYRYEAVAVIHKDLNINNVQGLRGLKSCHTGVGRNVGYKIPITKLTDMGVLNNLHDPEYSARENELRALSSLFSKGCLVGTWSPDPAINRRLSKFL